LSVEHDDSDWTYDSVEEFIADYRKFKGGAKFSLRGNLFGLSVLVQARNTRVAVSAPSRPDIESVFEVFEKNLSMSALPPVTLAEAKITPTVFIGHGRNPMWRDLKDHLQDKHGIKVTAYETGARAGHTIRDILEELVATSSFAVLLLTGEDEQADGTLHARQNVIHEVGLFQGRLGFARAITVIEEGTQVFSNLQGVAQIRFSKANIKETFGDIVATIRREFAQ